MNTFIDWWQHLPARLDPVLIELGPLKIQYYGLMYIVAFAITYALVIYRLRSEKIEVIGLQQVKDLTTYMILGLIIGARLGYVFFYNWSYYWAHPLEIILPFDFSDGMRFTGISGMSYHGGLIGAILAAAWYLRRHAIAFWPIADLYIPAIPIAYTFGRLGNFINGELYGRATDASIGMYFPLDPTRSLRHPSQLYEAFFEGIFLFVILWPLRRKQGGPPGRFLAFYLFGYGCVRFFIEFFREPDAHIGFVFFSLSMGQLLCSLMMAAGIILYIYLAKRSFKSASET
jgi:phosphatidylglycerol:prolipoprotein diacylglycerol transferase